MVRTRIVKFVPALLFAAPLAVTVINGCSAAKEAQQAAAGCDGLSASVNNAQATLLAFAQASADLNAAAAKVQAKFLAACNAINGELGLDTTKTTAADACAILHAKVQAIAAAGGTVTVTVTPNCTVDLAAQASCEGKCSANASCDVTAHCTGGEVVVQCNGGCSGQCDVTKPDFACMGSCEGTCTSDLMVSCMGTCEGSCTAPTFEGTCDVGCTAMFEGKCGGMCNGMCDGTATTGTCTGTCKGTCSAMATGSCQAQCMGKFSGGKCTGMCTGSCTASGGIQCSGHCNGTCKYTPPSAMCQGECHGMCDAQVSPPTCTGSVDCMATAECHGSCQASAQANVDCSRPQVDITITGNDDAILLSAAVHKHLVEWGEAWSLFKTLQTPVSNLGGKTIAAFSAIGDVGVGGVTCLSSSLAVVGQASASVQVSVSVSATFSASAN